MPKDISVSIGYGTQDSIKRSKGDVNKKRKHSIDDDVDDEEEIKTGGQSILLLLNE